MSTPNPVTNVLSNVVNQAGNQVVTQLIQLAAGYILHLQGSHEEAASVLARIGLPSDVNINPVDFQKFLDSQKAGV